MISHGKIEITALADTCELEEYEDVNSWTLDAWTLDQVQVDLAIDAYQAVLGGGASAEIKDLLTAEGIDLDALLKDGENSKDDITRSDVAELIAAASMIAVPGNHPENMYMPNIPTMSRRKSDSGVDIMILALGDELQDELLPDEQLTFVSVKHSVDPTSAQSVRYKIANSLSETELSATYVTTQLRVLHGRLCEAGTDMEIADRVYYFLRGLPSSENVKLVGVGVVSPELEDDFLHQVTLLPEATGPSDRFRMVFVPELGTLHESCP